MLASTGLVSELPFSVGASFSSSFQTVVPHVAFVTAPVALIAGSLNAIVDSDSDSVAFVVTA